MEVVEGDRVMNLELLNSLIGETIEAIEYADEGRGYMKQVILTCKSGRTLSLHVDVLDEFYDRIGLSIKEEH